MHYNVSIDCSELSRALHSCKRTRCCYCRINYVVIVVLMEIDKFCGMYSRYVIYEYYVNIGSCYCAVYYRNRSVIFIFKSYHVYFLPRRYTNGIFIYRRFSTRQTTRHRHDVISILRYFSLHFRHASLPPPHRAVILIVYSR